MSSLGNFVWGIADQLRGVYQPHQYGSVILPMTVLRRLDCLMDGKREQMRDLAEQYPNPTMLAAKVRKECGLEFHNTSRYDLARLVADPGGLAANLLDYLPRS